MKKYGFGRLIEFDDRSRDFEIRSLILKAAEPISHTWKCSVNLDQGDKPACTGFSVCQEAAAQPIEVPNITNRLALSLYRRAQELDDYPGEDYDGSSVLGAMKAGVEKGWYDEYRWAFSEEDLALAVGHKGPAVLGVNWYDGMMEPNADGLVKVTGHIRGGHAILCNGYDVKTKLYRLHNSWGKKWGKSGEGFISAADMAKVLEREGEACIPIGRRMGKRQSQIIHRIPGTNHRLQITDYKSQIADCRLRARKRT